MSRPDTRSEISRVRGLGSAKAGVQHWWAQRLTAIALNATLTILTLAMVFHHAQLGLQVVIEDYVHNEAAKITLLIAVKLLALILALAGALAVLRLMLGGAA
jgi:succinate dehydrogenase / fumarate reductase membrane anchor subunit